MQVRMENYKICSDLFNTCSYNWFFKKSILSTHVAFLGITVAMSEGAITHLGETKANNAPFLSTGRERCSRIITLK